MFFFCAKYYNIILTFSIDEFNMNSFIVVSAWINLASASWRVATACSNLSFNSSTLLSSSALDFSVRKNNLNTFIKTHSYNLWHSLSKIIIYQQQCQLMVVHLVENAL